MERRGPDPCAPAWPRCRTTRRSSSCTTRRARSRATQLFAAVIDAVTAGADGAVPGVAVSDTIKHVDGDRVVATVPRDDLVTVQTPQAFRAAMPARRARRRRRRHRRCRAGRSARVARWSSSTGSRTNVKVTSPEDLSSSTALLALRAAVVIRVGMGFDVHPFGGDGPLVLGGVTIDGRGLRGALRRGCRSRTRWPTRCSVRSGSRTSGRCSPRRTSSTGASRRSTCCAEVAQRVHAERWWVGERRRGDRRRGTPARAAHRRDAGEPGGRARSRCADRWVPASTSRSPRSGARASASSAGPKASRRGRSRSSSSPEPRPKSRHRRAAEGPATSLARCSGSTTRWPAARWTSSPRVAGTRVDVRLRTDGLRRPPRRSRPHRARVRHHPALPRVERSRRSRT